MFSYLYILSSLSLLSLLCRIIYWFFGELLCTEICCTISTPNLQQNPPFCCFFYLYCLNYLVYFYSSYSILTYSFYEVSYFVIFVTLSNLFLFLWFPAIFYYVSVKIVIEILIFKLSVFIIFVFCLSNIHRYLSSSVNYSWSHSIVLSAFYRFIFLSN